MRYTFGKMSKEIPDIPDHLQESVRSAAAYEQDVRREFQISDYARKRQIPEVSMQTNATVRRYVTVLRDADAATDRLGRDEVTDFVRRLIRSHMNVWGKQRCSMPLSGQFLRKGSNRIWQVGLICLCAPSTWTLNEAIPLLAVLTGLQNHMDCP
jgi:hypothetical protein